MAKPSVLLNNYLSGDDAKPSAAIYSAASLPIYKKSVSILRMPKEARLNEIEKAPGYLQARLKETIIELNRRPRKHL